jgi:hypothetical protein
MTATRPPVAPAPRPAPQQPAGARRPWPEQRLFLAALGLVALHVVDDSFVQPQPGTSAGDHLVSGLVPLAVLGLAAAAYPRLRAAVALVVGFFGVDNGDEAGWPKFIWGIPEAGHVGAQDARPREYELRVTRFLDNALRKEQP